MKKETGASVRTEIFTAGKGSGNLSSGVNLDLDGRRDKLDDDFMSF
jgi:hypothetical protein